MPIMYLQLVREGFTDKATEGKLFVNGAFKCYTLEDFDRRLEDGGEKVYAETAIPRGTYNVVLSMSPRFKKVLPLLENVPGFTGIRIHTGNKSADTEGCILVGSSNASNTDDWIGGSVAAMKPLMSKLEAAAERGEEITIEIV